MDKHIDENWAISIERARAFFADQPDVTETEHGFRYRKCHIILTELHNNRAGIFSVPRTRIQITGDEQDIETIHRRFFLRFLSAGG